MPRTPKKDPEFDPALVDAFIGDAKSTEEVEDLFRRMHKALMERILSGELTHHLGYEKGEPKPAEQANHRNGSTPKTVLTDQGAIPLEIPRDRAGSFEPKLVPKGVRRLPRFDQNVLSLYARGMTVKEIREHLEELYQVEVAADVISTVTDAVIEEVTAWQQRPLDRCYPVMIFDALRVKIRDEGLVRNKAVYLALGITREGHKEILGLWIEQTEGAKFWHRVMSELQARGVQDILLALIDGLSGFPEAIHAVFPATEIHTCVVHLMRRSLAYVGWPDRKRVAGALRAIYRADNAAAAEAALTDFAASADGKRFATIVPLWKRQWPYLIPIFAYPPSVRRMLSTTNAIESIHMQLRKIIKNRGHFPNDEAAVKLLYLAIRNIKKRWGPSRDWRTALQHFAVLFPERFNPDEL